MQLIYKEDYIAGLLTSSIAAFIRSSKSPRYFCTGNHRGKIKGNYVYPSKAPEPLCSNFSGKALGNGGFTDAGFAY